MGLNAASKMTTCMTSPITGVPGIDGATRNSRRPSVWLSRALTLVLTLSFVTYLAPSLDVSLQFVPLAVFALLVFFTVFFSASALKAVQSLFAVDGVLFAVSVSLLTLVPSIQSNSHRSLAYAVLIAVCLILGRLYMAVVLIRQVLDAFFWSRILSIGIFRPLTLTGLMQAIDRTARFSVFSFQPNTLPFLLAGYFCVTVWKFMTPGGPVKILAALCGFLCLVITFFASSRGPIVAILAGCGFIAGMAVLGARMDRGRGLPRLSLLAAALPLGLGILIIFIQNPEWTNDIYVFVDQGLQLSSKYRGLDTGFTGRLDGWTDMMPLLSDGTSLVGRGMRSSDSLPAIDNSYVLVLYEIGPLALILITWRFFRILLRSLKGYFGSIEGEQRQFYLACSLLIVVFLANNIVTRYLFAVPNLYSLLAFFLLAAPRARLMPLLYSHQAI